MHTKPTMCAVALFALLVAGCGQRQVSYQRDINPILQANCAVCHQPGAPGFEQSGFSVMSYESVIKGTKYGSVIDPGSSIGSTLVRLLRHQADTTINMPKNYKADMAQHAKFILPGVNARDLPATDVEMIATWVDQGAKNN